MVITLDEIKTIVELVGLLIALPIAFWKIWRRIDIRLVKQEERLIRIEAQFHRNGGSTLRDSIDRMDRDMAKLTGRFEQHITEGE